MSTTSALVGRQEAIDVQSARPTTASLAAERRAGVERLELPPKPIFEQLGYARPVAQVLACGALGFVRLTEPGFEVYSYRTLRRTARYVEGAFTHVTSQPGYSYLFVGSGPSLLYYQANPRLTALGHLPALGPFTIWSDQQDLQRVWVHYLKDDAVHHFALPRDTSRRGELLGTTLLSNFDGTQLARLTAGQWLYAAHTESGTGAQFRVVGGARTAWVGGLPERAQAVIPGLGASVWVLSPHHALAFEQSPFDRLEPRGAVELADEPWAAASDGSRLAVLGQQVIGSKRHWSVQIVEAAKAVTRLGVALNDGGGVSSASRRTVCLVPGRPWVVVGGPNELLVIDFATGKEMLAR